MTGGNVKFDPVNRSSGDFTVGGAVIGSNGQYSIPPGSTGLVPGEYRVEVTYEDYFNKQGEVYVRPAGPMTLSRPPVEYSYMQVVPEKYNKNSEIKVTLNKKKTTFDFDMTADQGDLRKAP